MSLRPENARLLSGLPAGFSKELFALELTRLSVIKDGQKRDEPSRADDPQPNCSHTMRRG